MPEMPEMLKKFYCEYCEYCDYSCRIKSSFDIYLSLIGMFGKKGNAGNAKHDGVNESSLSRFGDLLYKNLNYFWAKYFGKIENGHLLMSIFQFTE